MEKLQLTNNFIKMLPAGAEPPPPCRRQEEKKKILSFLIDLKIQLQASSFLNKLKYPTNLCCEGSPAARNNFLLAAESVSMSELAC